jgi:hypothetical protein
MSILSNWFKQASTKVILKSALAILKALAFGVGEQLWGVVRSEVAHVEGIPGLSGEEKARRVAKAVKAAFPEIKNSLVNLAIELAVSYLKESMIKK